MPRKDNLPVHHRMIEAALKEANLDLGLIIDNILDGYDESAISKKHKIPVEIWQEIAPDISGTLHNSFKNAATRYFVQEQNDFKQDHVNTNTFCESKRCNSMTLIEFSTADARRRFAEFGVLEFEVSLIPEIHVSVSIRNDDQIPRITQVIGENFVEYSNDDLEHINHEAFLYWIIQHVMMHFKRLIR